MVLILFNFIKVTAVFKPSQIHNWTGHKCLDNGLKITHFSIRFSHTPTVAKLWDGCLKVRSGWWENRKGRADAEQDQDARFLVKVVSVRNVKFAGGRF